MDFRKLEYFIAAVEHGSFTKAAQECFVSQTAMSQQIAAMEQELDFLLFDRSNYRPTLTLAGKAFYESSKQIIADYQQAVKKAKALKNDFSGSLRIGISGPVEKQFLPEVLSKFVACRPEVNLELHELSFRKLSEKIRNSEIDIMFGLANEIEIYPQIETTILFTSTLCVIVSTSHPWHDRSEIYGNELKSEKLIIFSKTYGPKYYESFFKSCKCDGFEPNILREVENFDELILLVSANKGIAIISEEVLTETSGIHQIKLKETHHHSAFCMARNRNADNPLINEFMQLLINKQ
ncbi:LysR family transcriptional regulator [Acetobacterium carbinolicum]|uniref:LysR family transcriptional regulator n=1 Tax=Acetobacterium carbinolicum TaxID=52690 RepID=UPI0039C991FB